MESKAKKHYREYCEQANNVPVFAQPWYLDVACANNWDVAEATSKNRTTGFLPYLIRKRGFFFNTIGQAPLTPFTYFIRTTIRELSDQSRTISQSDFLNTLQGIKPSIFTRFHFDPEILNGIPIHQLGYDISTRYSFELSDIKNHQAIWEGFDSNVRNHIKKHQQFLFVEESNDVESFNQLVMEVFQRQNQNLPFSSKMFTNLDSELAKRSKRKILLILDEAGLILSGVYLVFDRNLCFCLLTGTRSSARSLHPLSTLYWESIKIASKSADKFNFLGSMIPSIERMFRSFNGKQIPYISAIKAPMLVKLLRGE